MSRTEAAAVDEDEHIEPRTFTLADAREMVRRGEIVDMKTVVGLTLTCRIRSGSQVGLGSLNVGLYCTRRESAVDGTPVCVCAG